MSRPTPRIWQYWDTGEVPQYVSALIETFDPPNAELEHVVLSESEAEQVIRDGFSLREVAAFRACAVPAMQADYFRYCAILAHGGIYVDVDYCCAGPLRPLLDQEASGELFTRPESYVIRGRTVQRLCNSFFVFEQAGHPLLELVLEIATANLEEKICERVWQVGENVRESVWMTVGPGIFTMLHFLNVLGSFDELREVTAGTPAEPFMDLYCDVIGDRDRVTEAFSDVRVSPYDSMLRWVAVPEARLAYKDTPSHWQNVRTSIFR